jgi:hypothetical protein
MTQPRSAFHFDAADRELLRSALRAASVAVIPRLEELVSKSRGRTLPQGMRPYATEHRPDVQAIVGPLAQLVENIDRMPPELWASFDMPTLGMILGWPGRLPAPGPIASISRRSSADILTVIRELGVRFLERFQLPRKGRGRPGRPKKQTLHLLALEVAALLKRHDVSVTTSRTGKYGKVLDIVFRSVLGSDCPTELFPYIKSAVDDLKEMNQNRAYRAVLIDQCFALTGFWRSR